MDISPRKMPLQKRSQAMVEIILEAATRVLAIESLAGFNTNRVAEVAGVSIGSLYQYFPNKSSLVSALIEHAQTELAESFEKLVCNIVASCQNTLLQSLHEVAKLSIAQQYANPILAAALDHEEARLPVQNQIRATQERLLQSVSELFAHHQNELATDLPESCVRDCFTMTKALVEMEAGVNANPPADLEKRIVRALLGYLTVQDK
jgi:AcrR family transcriptional regulator